jgi:hypothetical protein
MTKEQEKFLINKEKEFRDRFTYRDMDDRPQEMIDWVDELTKKCNGNETVKKWFLEILKNYEQMWRLLQEC